MEKPIVRDGIDKTSKIPLARQAVELVLARVVDPSGHLL